MEPQSGSLPTMVQICLADVSLLDVQTGACRYGATCRFDHPPPGEAVAKASAMERKPEMAQTIPEVVLKEVTEPESSTRAAEVTPSEVEPALTPE